MAFRKKWNSLNTFSSDLMIISECEHESKFKESQKIKNSSGYIWVGKNPNKGLGIIAFNNFSIEICPYYSEEYQYVVPIRVSNGDENYLILAIWAMPHKTSRSKGYVGQIWEAVNHYSDQITNRTILMGDFNSNSIWDKMRKVGNHTDVENFLSSRGIISLYHNQTKELSGREITPTLFLHKKNDKPFHIDYCFASEKLINSNTEMTIGEYKDWIHLSDHMPIFVKNLG